MAGIVQSWTQQVGGEFLEIIFDPTLIPLTAQPFGKTFMTQPGYYNGCTLTILNPGIDASVAAESTRIVSYSPILDPTNTITQIYITIEWSAGEGGVEFYPLPNITRFLINGRPFNGTGAGYDTTTYKLDQLLNSQQTALLPNYRMYADLDSGPNSPNLGGLDEPWDAVDFQNMFGDESAEPAGSDAACRWTNLESSRHSTVRT